MNFLREPCTIGVLRPACTQRTRLLRHAYGPRDVSEAERDFGMDRIIESIREMLDEAAASAGIRIGVTEYQLFRERGEAVIAGRKRVRRMIENDVLVALDPDPLEFAFVSTPSNHPLQRAVVAFTDRETLMDHAPLTGACKVEMIGLSGVRQSVLQRMFVLHTPVNEDAESTLFRGNVNVVARALQYPNVRPIARYERPVADGESSPDSITVVRSDDRIAQPECARHLRMNLARGTGN